MSLLCSVPPEKPSVFSRELTDTTVTEGEELTLVCEITTLDGSVCWTKDGKVLRPSARCQLSQEGHRAQLIITGATMQDGGRYKCEAGDSWSSSIVRVHGKFPGSCPCLGAGGGPQAPCGSSSPGRGGPWPPQSGSSRPSCHHGLLTSSDLVSWFLAHLCPPLPTRLISTCVSMGHITDTTGQPFHSSIYHSLSWSWEVTGPGVGRATSSRRSLHGVYMPFSPCVCVRPNFLSRDHVSCGIRHLQMTSSMLITLVKTLPPNTVIVRFWGLGHSSVWIWGVQTTLLCPSLLLAVCPPPGRQCWGLCSVAPVWEGRGGPA